MATLNAVKLLDIISAFDSHALDTCQEIIRFGVNSAKRSRNGRFFTDNTRPGTIPPNQHQVRSSWLFSIHHFMSHYACLSARPFSAAVDNALSCPLCRDVQVQRCNHPRTPFNCGTTQIHTRVQTLKTSLKGHSNNGLPLFFRIQGCNRHIECHTKTLYQIEFHRNRTYRG